MVVVVSVMLAVILRLFIAGRNTALLSGPYSGNKIARKCGEGASSFFPVNRGVMR